MLPKLPVDPRPVCKLKFVRCGPVEKNRALSLSQSCRPDKVLEHLFPKSKNEIFDDFCQFLTKFLSFQELLRNAFKS